MPYTIFFSAVDKAPLICFYGYRYEYGLPPRSMILSVAFNAAIIFYNPSLNVTHSLLSQNRRELPWQIFNIFFMH